VDIFSGYGLECSVTCPGEEDFKRQEKADHRR
jgi:hypothetical protein